MQCRKNQLTIFHMKLKLNSAQYQGESLSFLIMLLIEIAFTL